MSEDKRRYKKDYRLDGYPIIDLETDRIFNNDDLVIVLNDFNANVERLEAEVERLKKAEKKAFWWSAEFTHVVHSGKIQKAWEDYNS